LCDEEENDMSKDSAVTVEHDALVLDT